MNKQAVKWDDVDIRLAVGEPEGEQAIKTFCPPHIHRSRIGQEDENGSMAVYRDNIHCYGCGFHIKRRYAGLAFLLGEWDGTGSVDSDVVRQAVLRIKSRLKKFVNEGREPIEFFVPPMDPYAADSFHQYLLYYQEDRLVDELMTKRGLTLDTVKEYRLGHTGTHFTIPVHDLDGSLYSIRYRADEQFTDLADGKGRKYEGTWRRNAPLLYPLRAVRGVSYLPQLWITEGEFDAIASNQAGNVTLTITNGASNIARIVEMVLGLGLKVGEWVIATDQDGAGNKAAEATLAVLSEHNQIGVRARWEFGKDLTEYYALGGSKARITYERVRTYTQVA